MLKRWLAAALIITAVFAPVVGFAKPPAAPSGGTKWDLPIAAEDGYCWKYDHANKTTQLGLCGTGATEIVDDTFGVGWIADTGHGGSKKSIYAAFQLYVSKADLSTAYDTAAEFDSLFAGKQAADADLTTAAGASAASDNTFFGKVGGTVGFHSVPNIDWTTDQGATNIHAGNIPTLNQNTTGTAAGLSVAFIDWDAASGGASILNKPTVATLVGGTVPTAQLPVAGAATGGIVTSGAGVVNKVWKTDADGIWGARDDATGGTPTFDTVGTGTNTTAVMTVGAGGSLSYSTTGAINASHYKGQTGPTAAQFSYLDATSSIQTQLNAKQGTDAEITALASTTSAANALPYFTGSGTAGVTTLSAFSRTYLDDADEATLKATLNMEAGVDFQAYNVGLTAIAAVTPAANALPYFTSSSAAAVTTLSAFARTVLDDADAATARTTLGAQTLDTELTALASTTSAANALPYFTGSGTAGVTTLSAFSRTYLDDADEATLKATLNMEAGVDFQAYSLVLADIADETILTNLVNTANPWTDAEVADILTVNGGTINDSIIGGTAPAAATFTTIAAGASGFSVDAIGKVIATEVSITKISGQPGYLAMYEANSTDVDVTGFAGPASITANTSYLGQFSGARPSSANMVQAWASTATSGDGTPTTPYLHALSWVDLDDYLLLAGGTLTGKLNTLASASGGAGLNLAHGAAPSSPVNGDLWTTTAGVYARINGGTVGPFGSYAADVTGGSTSATGEVAAYSDTTGKAIGRSYIAFSGPDTSVKTKGISNAADTIAELGQANNFGVAQTVSAVNAASGSVNALTLSGTLGAFNGSDTARGIYLNYTNANHTGTVNTVALVDVPAITGDANSNFYGLRFGAFTGTTGAAGEVERAIDIGAGFDHGIYSASPVYVAGTLQGRAAFNSYDTAQTLTEAVHGGSLVRLTVAGEITFWDCTATNIGSFATLWARDAEKIEVVPASGDQFTLFDGTALTANNELDMAATAGTKVCLMCVAENVIAVYSETAACADGGAAD